MFNLDKSEMGNFLHESMSLNEGIDFPTQEKKKASRSLNESVWDEVAPYLGKREAVEEDLNEGCSQEKVEEGCGGKWKAGSKIEEELSSPDTIAYDKGWEDFDDPSGEMPEGGEWLVKDFGDGIEGEIQADPTTGVSAWLYKSNTQVYRASDLDSIGQAVLTIERVAREKYGIE